MSAVGETAGQFAQNWFCSPLQAREDIACSPIRWGMRSPPDAGQLTVVQLLDGLRDEQVADVDRGEVPVTEFAQAQRSGPGAVRRSRSVVSSAIFRLRGITRSVSAVNSSGCSAPTRSVRAVRTDAGSPSCGIIPCHIA
jgi:hypothetical protein